MEPKRDNPEQAEFRAYCRRWLAEHRPAPPPFRLPQYAIEVMTEEQRRYLCAWQKQSYEAGLVACDFPTAYGGGGHSGFQRIANQELSLAGVPYLINVIGLSMAAPTILHHGSEEQKRRYLPPLFAADEIWCPTRAAISPACRPRRCARATTGSSTGTRCGPAWPISPAG
jgi:alkylation response protein AidB-like acyl-CoA dehydrogenase